MYTKVVLHKQTSLRFLTSPEAVGKFGTAVASFQENLNGTRPEVDMFGPQMPANCFCF